MLRGSPSRNWRPSEAVGRHLLQSIENGDSVKGEQGGERDIRAAGQGRRPGLWGRSLQGRHLSFWLLSWFRWVLSFWLLRRSSTFLFWSSRGDLGGNWGFLFLKMGLLLVLKEKREEESWFFVGFHWENVNICDCVDLRESQKNACRSEYFYGFSRNERRWKRKSCGHLKSIQSSYSHLFTDYLWKRTICTF